MTVGGCVFAHGLADGELLHVPLLLAGCSHAGTGYHSSLDPIRTSSGSYYYPTNANLYLR